MMGLIFAEAGLQGSILLKVLIAALLGGAIGFERESKDKPAGFRTNMIIAGASALLLTLGQFIASHMVEEFNDQALGIDPTRIIHAIIVGVSFIGAGTILKGKEEETVRYLTSAATILFSAGIGMAVGLDLYILAVGVPLWVWRSTTGWKSYTDKSVTFLMMASFA